MARIRTIKPEFWQNEGLASCSPHARLLAIAILQLADSEGRMRWIPMQVHAHAFPFESDLNIGELMAELSEIGYAHTYVVSGRTYAYIPTFNKHQRLSGKESEQKSECPEPPMGYDGEKPSASRGKTQCFTGKHLDAQEREREREREREEEGEGGAGGVTAVAVTTRSPAKRFQPPDPDESLSFAREMGMTENQHDQWRDYYESNGWKVGRNPMKDWKAAMRRWKRTDAAKQQTPGTRFTITKENLDEQQRKTDEAWKAHFGTDRRIPGQSGQDPDSLPEHQH